MSEFAELRHMRAQSVPDGVAAQRSVRRLLPYYNRLVEVSEPGKVSRLAVTAEGDVVHELDQWRAGI